MSKQLRSVFLVHVGDEVWPITGELLGVCNGVTCVTVAIDLTDRINKILVYYTANNQKEKRDAMSVMQILGPE